MRVDLEGLAATVLFVLFVVGIMKLAQWLNKTDGRNESWNWHRLNGEWRVLYPDNNYSQPMSRAVADDYAEMFGGTVVPRSAYKPKGETDAERD